MRWWRRIPPVAILIGLIVIALVLRANAFTGQSFSFGSDESRFIAVAQNLTNGYFPDGQTEWFGSRIGLIWPVALIYQVLPPSDLSTAIWPVLGSLLSVVVAYLLGRDLASRRVGLVAAALVAVAPLEVLVGTRLRPDAIVPGVLGLAVWFAMRSGRSAGRHALLAGLMLGMAWTVRENAVLLAPVLVVAGWAGGRRALRNGLIGALLPPAFVATVFAIGAGAPLQALLGAGTEGEWRNPVDRFVAADTYTAQLWRDAVDPGAPLFLAGPVVVAAIVLVLYRRERRALLPGVWAAWIALYLEFGTLVNLAKPPRYLTLCTIPIALLVALAVDGHFAWLAPAAAAAACVLVLVALPARALRDDDTFLVADVANRLRGLPAGPVLTESYTWWIKLQTYLATNRLAVPAALDPAFFSADDVRASRTLTPLPVPADYRGGYVVTGPVIPRPGWPVNWSTVRAAIARDVHPGDLVFVASVGSAQIWRWPR